MSKPGREISTPDDHLFRGCGDGLELASVPALVVAQDREFRAGSLRQALAHPPAHPRGPRRCGDGEHSPAVQHRGGSIGAQSRLRHGGHHGPIGHPQHHAAHGGYRGVAQGDGHAAPVPSALSPTVARLAAAPEPVR